MTFLPALLRASLGYISAFFAGAVTFNSGSDDNPKPFKVPGFVLAIVLIIVAIWVLTALKIRIPNPFRSRGTAVRRRAVRSFSRARRYVRRGVRRARRSVRGRFRRR